MVKVPFRDPELLRAEANRILAEYHPSGEIPVPIEQIVEIGYGLTIVPVRGLRDQTGAEGGLSADLDNITVDEWILEHRINRYRFTLAHELAHLVLHREQILGLAPEDTADWKASIKALSPSEYSKIEYQAYVLAGLILVPQGPLLRECESAAARARAHGLDLTALRELGMEYVAGWIAKAFQVSKEVISRRLKHEGLLGF